MDFEDEIVKNKIFAVDDAEEYKNEISDDESSDGESIYEDYE